MNRKSKYNGDSPTDTTRFLQEGAMRDVAMCKALVGALLQKLEGATEFQHVRGAVKEFIAATENKVHILGDGDLIDLAAAAAHRHGKPVWAGLALFEREMKRLEKAGGRLDA